MSRSTAALAALFLCVATPAVAGDDDLPPPANAVAHDHLTAGIRHYRLFEYQKAIDEYKAGVLIEDAPVFYLNLGQAYRKLGHCQEAIWNYQHYLDTARPLPDRYKQIAEGFISECKQTLATAATAPKATASSEPSNAVTVSVQDEPWYADGFGWGLAGTGLVASGVAIGLLLDARSLDNDANAAPTQTEQTSDRSRASDRRLAGTIIGVAGGLALITGIVKLAIVPERKSKPSMALGVSNNGFYVMGRF